MIAKTPKLVCWSCRKQITGARTVINEMWYCADTYRHDHPDKTIPEVVRPKTKKRQHETLFPLPPKERD